MNTKLNHSINKEIFISLMIIMVVFSVGVSFAYFNLGFMGNDKSSSFGGKTIYMEITNNGILNTTGSIKRPGDSFSQTFSITNTSSDSITSYVLYFSKVNNPFSRKSDLTYSITCAASSGSCEGVSSTILPSVEGVILTGGTIDSGVTHTYTITIDYANLDEDQSIDMNKKFSSKITVNEIETN